ncbi:MULTISPECIES: hypothetical protein [Bacillus subtilis group]|uniref:hypothetical protein n=1 Tax=Bacillus TaxID=1386 RepID=UPI0011A3C979|nr:MULTISPECIES: hypothetical protein [Bacillus subtilis group]MBT3123358.1 hypothetical protein [Bacillus inaquosorum]MCB5337169.1 hypothetical protein [Bacillus amyloliquefaciens]MCF7615494.1 hypothetical protein [Bacillus subtilis]QWK35409.1 hypothetical protein KM843_19820 [Bacillus velezensis]
MLEAKLNNDKSDDKQTNSEVKSSKEVHDIFDGLVRGSWVEVNPVPEGGETYYSIGAYRDGVRVLYKPTNTGLTGTVKEALRLDGLGYDFVVIFNMYRGDIVEKYLV